MLLTAVRLGTAGNHGLGGANKWPGGYAVLGRVARRDRLQGGFYRREVSTAVVISQQKAGKP